MFNRSSLFSVVVGRVVNTSSCSDFSEMEPETEMEEKEIFCMLPFTVMVHLRFSLLLRGFVFRMPEASAKRLTGDEPQGTMGRVQTLSPSRLPLRAHFHQKRDVWVRGSLQNRKYSRTSLQLSPWEQKKEAITERSPL